ncbi:MAG: CBS domain-containing protein [Ruminococcaceae bacterium]|nr:CBS domain-containing protein [Oscillospiraceae bacterium]
MKIKDVMTKTVTCIKHDASVYEAAEVMRDLDVGSLPVCDADQMLIGMVTDRDIVLRSVAMREDITKQPVQDIMTVDPLTGDPEMDIDEANELMSKNQIRRLPIMKDNRLVGILALGDLAIKPDLKTEAGEILSEVSEQPVKV